MRSFLSLALVLCLLAVFAAAAAETRELTGVGQGNNGEIRVQVTLDGETIAAVDVLEHSETAGICDAALSGIPAAMVAANSAEVDTVAGATNTSKGIIAAVKDALGVETEIEEHKVSYNTHNFVSPKVETLENGVKIQKTPDSAMGWSWFTASDFDSYNTTYLHADQRGCSSCHDLEDCLLSIGHVVYKGAYAAEDMPVQNCIACHSDTYSGFGLQQPIHSLHMGNQAVVSAGGSCESCHYIDKDGNYLRWDFVKYDVLHGITDIPADQVNVSIDWNQTQLTEEENMFTVKWGKHRAMDFGFTYDHVAALRCDDIRDSYTVNFSGDIANPCELTINEMIEMFGSETRTICGQCSINGIGSSLIYQCEVTGIPLNKVVEYLQVSEDANLLTPVCIDNYPITVPTENAMAQNPLLVYEMNGHELSDEQGYPVALWFEDYTCGLYARTMTGLRIYKGDPSLASECYGPFVDTATGYRVDTPNIGVLTAESGQIFTPGEPVHLEGYADAFEEPIAKMEFSFDRGATWVEIPTENTDDNRWVYWTMDINDLDVGAYVLSMRATSVTADGSLRVNEEIPKFLINVK